MTFSGRFLITSLCITLKLNEPVYDVFVMKKLKIVNHWRRKRGGGGGGGQGGKGGMCPPLFFDWGGGAIVCLCLSTFNPTFLC